MKKYWSTGVLLLMVVVIGVGFIFFKKNKPAVINWQDGQVYQIELGVKEVTVVAAVSEQAIGDGLSRKAQMPAQGMIFVFNPPQTVTFWMKEMNFALDMVWIKDNRIIGVTKNVPSPVETERNAPTQLYPAPAAVDFVIELEGGKFDEWQLQLGDYFQVKI